MLYVNCKVLGLRDSIFHIICLTVFRSPFVFFRVWQMRSLCIYIYILIKYVLFIMFIECSLHTPAVTNLTSKFS